MAGAMRRSLSLMLVRSSLAERLRVAVVPPAMSRGFADEVPPRMGPTYYSRDEVTNRVLNVVKNFPKVNISKVSPTAHFQKDLGLDSLDAVEVVMAFEDEFDIEIPDGESDKIVSCAEAIEYISTRPRGTGRQEAVP